MKAPVATKTDRIPYPQSRRLGMRLHALIHWLLSGTHSRPDEIRTHLLHQRASRIRTQTVAIIASLLTAVIATALTGAAWAYAWTAAEVVLGSIRVYLMLKEVAKVKAAEQAGTAIAPVWAGLASVILISVGTYQCVGSGLLPLMLMSGIGTANLVAGITSRNAATPGYGALLICILTLPFGLATLLSPIPYLFLVGLQTPMYTAAMIFLLLENHKGLFNLHRAERRNRQMAHHDLLTGLPNRALNQKLFAELLAVPEPTASNAKLTVFCLDLDGFKAVNDGMGHATGDAVLVDVSKRLRDSVRDVDFACRLGGDEFVILLPGITANDATVIARRIVAAISTPFTFAPAVKIGVSIGIAVAPRDGNTADELLSAADRAMYEAKRGGKGGYVMYAPEVEGVSLVPGLDADDREFPEVVVLGSSKPGSRDLFPIKFAAVAGSALIEAHDGKES